MQHAHTPTKEKEGQVERYKAYIDRQTELAGRGHTEHAFNT